MEPRTPSEPCSSADVSMTDPAPAHLAEMLDSLSDGFMSIDKSWRFTYLNQTAERYLQQEGKNLLGRDIWECYPDLVGSGYHRAYQHTALTGEPDSYTGYYVPLDTWFEARSFRHDDGITVLFRDVTRVHRYAEQLQYDADHDVLTGLANRRKCMETLAHAVTAPTVPSAPDEVSVAVLFIDLDHLKDVNDAFGHRVGDDLLREFAKRLLALPQCGVFAARVGGDEFVLLIPETTLPAAQACARDVLNALAVPFALCGRSIFLSASIGIALDHASAGSAETLLSRADAAMYAAKSAGGLQSRVYDAALDHGIRDRAALRAELGAAFSNNEFELHFQPQCTLADASPFGAEALIRWRHPKRGLLLPASFLSLLLQAPYENRLVEWLLDSAYGQIRAWQQTGLKVPKISVNLSARQLLDVGLAEKILRFASKHAVSPGMVDIEITEDSLIADVDTATRVLESLKQAGISTSLDDFGVGYSSLSYLVRLPIDTLKIDRSIVTALGSGDKAFAVIRGIVSLAGSLGIKTIAEGVEHENQADALRAIGCDAMQGYLFSRPLNAEAFERFVRAAA